MRINMRIMSCLAESVWNSLIGQVKVIHLVSPCVSVARCAIKSRTGAPFGHRARLVFVVRAGAPFGAPFSHLCAGVARLTIFRLFHRRFAKF